MAKLKLLHVTSSLKVGGAESLLFDILREIDKTVFENHVIYFHYGPNIERIEKLGIPTYQIEGLFCKYDPIFFFRLFLLIRRLNPDCIHSLLWSANFSSAIVAKLLNIPIFCVLHSSWNLGSSLDSNMRLVLDKVTFNCVNVIICVSQNISDNIKIKYPLISQKVSVIKNGIDSQYILNKGSELKKSRKEFGLEASDFVIGTVGRLVEVKNYYFLIETISVLFKKYENIKLIILGDGPLKDFLLSKIRDLAIEDKVTIVSSPQAYGYYPLFDCFVQCSTQEGLSIALLEAMSFGITCIVTAKEHEVIVPDYNGYLSKFDIFELSGKIEFVYKNRYLSKEISINSQKTIFDSFSLKTMIDSYEKVCKNLSRIKK